jgi:hypothetical protein
MIDLARQPCCSGGQAPALRRIGTAAPRRIDTAALLQDRAARAPEAGVCAMARSKALNDVAAKPIVIGECDMSNRLDHCGAPAC